MRWLAWWLPVSVACSEPPTTETTPSDPFATPWEEVDVVENTVSGQFRAVLGAETPGAGWFRTGEQEAHDYVQAAVQSVEGATWPVVHLRLGGHDSAGWRTLELDVALNHWVAGDIPVDGTAAVGVLTNPNGASRFVVGGVLQVTAAGVSPGDRVEGSFRNLTLTEVAP